MTSPIDRSSSSSVDRYSCVDDSPRETTLSSSSPATPDYDSLHSAPAVAPPATPATTTDSPGVALENYPDAVLEHQVTALRGRLSAGTEYAGRADDQKQLSGMEAELIKRQAAARKPDHVELCKRDADLPLNDKIHLQHHWIRTTKTEAGMGPAGGGIPGHGDSLQGLPLAKTTINDHSQETQKSCEVVPDIDEDCVNRELEIGKDTGRWLPPFNDCQTFAKGVLDRCRTVD